MAIYSNIVKPVNGMDLWSRSDKPAILPPQYNRQPGRPKTKRMNDQSEKDTDGLMLGRVQKSLKCSNCGNLGYNVKTCNRHLPPKEKISKKRKQNSGEGTLSQSQDTKKPQLMSLGKRLSLGRKSLRKRRMSRKQQQDLLQKQPQNQP